MAQAFGVSVEFLDRELARFISAGRLSCKIDKVAGIVETNRPDQKNAQYQAAIKKVSWSSLSPLCSSFLHVHTQLI